MSINENDHFIDATYRYETILNEKISDKYALETSFVRNLKVFYLGKIKENSYFQVICLQYILSNEDQADVILLKKLSYLWDNIEIVVNKENTIVKVLNLLEIKMQWILIKNKLSPDYQGNAVESYFTTIDNLLESEKEVCRFLNSYKMFGMLFNGQYGGYNDSGQKFRSTTEQNIEVEEKLEISKKENKSEVKVSVEASKMNEFEIYKGLFLYENDHLVEVFLSFKKSDKNIKYSLLWIG